ncbi:MAG TPA: class I SAM-dependent methyltransferase [Verrucomicrobiae bacterium]|nr:class I SAM-dependent methyltransferase [Verrucomicrobiae bacterium]
MSQSLLYRDCPVCDQNAARPHWQKGELHIVRCDNCRMIYVNPVPGEMATGQFYDDAGKDYYLSPDKLESDYADVRFERELRLFRKYCPRGSVLDVGCSSGAFLFQLRQRWPADYKILGTDASGPPLDYAESRGVPVGRGNFLERDFSIPGGAPVSGPARSRNENPPAGSETGAPFDAITFWAVIEHLAEPKKFLEQAHSLLKPGGLCFVLVPNVGSLATRLLGRRYRYVYAQHLNYFSETTLGQLAAAVDYQLVTTRVMHFNPVVIWQDLRGGGREVSNVERAQLLKRTTAYKQSLAMKPIRLVYTGTEKLLGALKLADNLAVVLRKPG